MKKTPRVSGLLKNGIVFSAISFLTGLGNLAFQCVLGRHLKESGDYGTANSALSAIMPLLGLLPTVATFAVTHYIAHFNASGDSAQLQGLLMGCKKFLLRLTVAGSALAIIAAGPLSHYFHYSKSLMLLTLVCTLLGLWTALVTALCQGLSWFKRLALILFLTMVLRVLFGWFVTLRWPSAETAVLASAFALLANLVLLFWRKELSLHGTPVSPWNREFVQYLAVSAACVGGGFFFTQGDMLVMQHYFTDSQRDAYATAERLAVALPMTVGPLLSVLFTSRSGERAGNIVREQFKLLRLYTLGLMIGAAGLLALRDFCVKLILGESSPQAAGMISHLALTMVFVGLLQALAMWVLASRWIKIALLYGGLGLAYWLTLLCIGKSPAELLRVMPVAAGVAFAVLFCVWLIAMRLHKIGGQTVNEIATNHENLLH
jgi:O-antigen/teichoic acid export membrane protein